MNPNNVWFASDLHLEHAAMTQCRPDGTTWRKPGYEERFFSACNQLIKQDDVFFLLGDIAFSRLSYWFHRIQKLPGHKVLVCGNHDKNRENWYRKFGFSMVIPFGNFYYLRLLLKDTQVGTADYGNIILSHVPTFESVGTAYDDRFQGLMRKGERWFNRASCILNLHGHTHGFGAEKHNTFDVGLDVVGEQPITLAQILDLKFPSIGLPEVEFHDAESLGNS